MSSKYHGLAVVGAALMAAGWTTGAVAADPAVPDHGDWRFEVTPYAWLAGLEGDATVRGRTVDFDKSFSDLFDATELAGSVRLGAQYRNKFLVGALVDYFSMSTDELDVDDQPRLGSVDSTMLLTEVAAGIRVDGWAEGQTFGLMLGVRNLHIENDLKLNAGPKLSQDNDITDAMFYVLPNVPILTSKIEGLVFNPVMGIGAGDSDLSYELFPQVQYQVTEGMVARFGYRRVGYKFEGDRRNELDLSMAGLVVGLGVMF